MLEEGTLSTFEEDLMLSGKFTRKETNNRIFERVLKEYLIRFMGNNKVLNYDQASHVLKLLDSLRI